MSEQDWQEYLLIADIIDLEHMIYQIETEIQRRENDEQED